MTANKSKQPDKKARVKATPRESYRLRKRKRGPPKKLKVKKAKAKLFEKL